MKISQAIKILKAAQKQYGDLPIALINGETGYAENIKQIYKTHPIGKDFCLDRGQPPCQVIFSTSAKNSPDLVLGAS